MTQSSPGPAGQTAVRPLRVAQMSQIALKPHETGVSVPAVDKGVTDMFRCW